MALILNKTITINYIASDLTLTESIKTIDGNIDITTKLYTVANNAYIKIISIEGDKTSLNITIGAYDKQDGKLLDKSNCTFIPSVTEGSTNFIEQGYTYLKTLDEYKEAIDC